MLLMALATAIIFCLLAAQKGNSLLSIFATCSSLNASHTSTAWHSLPILKKPCIMSMSHFDSLLRLRRITSVGSLAIHAFAALSVFFINPLKGNFVVISIVTHFTMVNTCSVDNFSNGQVFPFGQANSIKRF